MTPTHILTEIAHRLPFATSDRLVAIAKALGIDAIAAAEPLPAVADAAPNGFPSSQWEKEVIHGAVPFEMRLAILGQEVTQSCRAVFSACLIDDVERKTGKPIRVLGPVEINWQYLDWRDLETIDEETGEHPRANVPVWTEDFEGLLPAAVPGLILDLIEQQAVAIEDRQRSTA